MAENISVPESDTGRPTVRASTREPQLSEKGHQYKVGQLEAKLKRALSSWRRQSIAIEELLSDSDDIELIRKGRDSLTALFNSATSALKDYTRLVVVARWLLDWITRQFVRRISEYITTSTKG